LLGPTGKRAYSTRETPAFRERERLLKKVGQRGWKRKKQRKNSSPKFDSVLAVALDVLYSRIAYIDDVQYGIFGGLAV